MSLRPGSYVAGRVCGDRVIAIFRGKSRRERCPVSKTHILAVLELLALIMDFVGFRGQYSQRHFQTMKGK